MTRWGKSASMQAWQGEASEQETGGETHQALPVEEKPQKHAYWAIWNRGDNSRSSPSFQDSLWAMFIWCLLSFDDYESKTRQQGIGADKYTVILIYTLRSAIDVGSPLVCPGLGNWAGTSSFGMLAMKKGKITIWCHHYHAFRYPKASHSPFAKRKCLAPFLARWFRQRDKLFKLTSREYV
jgi:hypothetical protein